MLDGLLKRQMDPMLYRAGAVLAERGISANTVTFVSCALGLAAAGAIASGHLIIGLAVLLISRIGDGLDGAVARHTRPTDFGGLLDIVLDFVFYGAIPLAFVVLDPQANAVAGAVLIFSFYVNGASFLAYAVAAEKRRLSTTSRGPKSIYFTTGLAEATETYMVFAAFCLWPSRFALFAWIFAAITIYTAISRLVLARAVFADESSDG